MLDYLRHSAFRMTSFCVYLCSWQTALSLYTKGVFLPRLPLSAPPNPTPSVGFSLYKKQEHVIDMLLLESGSDLLSRAVSSQVPSARRGLTSVFGMGTGGSLLPLPPEILRAARSRFRSLSALRFRASPALTTAQLKLTSERLHSISRFFLD